MNNSLQVHEETASNYFHKGNLLKQSDKLEEAAAAYQRCTELNPEFSWYHHNLGEVLAKLGQRDGAEKSYRRACELNPNSAWSWHNLGEVLEQQGNLDEAVAAYRKSVEIYPDFYEFHNSLGKALCLQGQLDESVSCLRRAIELDSESALPYQNLWEALARQGRVDEGIECLRHAIDLNPGDGELYLKLAEALQGKNELAEAVGYYRKAIQLKPDFHWLYYKLGTALSAQGQWEEAIAAYSNAAELEPSSGIVHHYLGHTLSIVQRWEEAIESYRKALQIAPDSAIVYQHLGDALAKLQKWEESVDAYGKSVQFEPNSLEAQDHLGFALYQLGRCDEAIVAYRKALEVAPFSDVVNFHLADALRQRGTQPDLDEAYKYYNQAIESNPNNLDIYHKMLALKPQDVQLYIKLCEALEKQNQWQKALVLYKMGLVLHPSNKIFLLAIERILDRSNKLLTKRGNTLSISPNMVYEQSLKNKLQYQVVSTSPDDVYAQWLRENSLRLADFHRMVDIVQALKYQPLVSIIMPVYNTPELFLRESIESVLAQVYNNWELCIADDASTLPYVKQVLEEYLAKDPRIKVAFRNENGHIAACSNTALNLATGEFVSFLDHDDVLTPDALYEIALLLNRHPEADMIYSDEDKLDEQGQRTQPYFKPDWCPDLFLSQMYTCHFSVYRRNLATQLGGFRLAYAGCQDYDLALRLTEKTNKIFHIPKILYHWRIHPQSAASGISAKPYVYELIEKLLAETISRRGENGRIIEVPGFPGNYTIRYSIQTYKKVSIIIPTKNLGTLLNQCLKSIFEKSTYPTYEVVVINNGSDEAEAASVISFWQIQEPKRFKCYDLDIPFNYSKINNYAVSKAQGDYLLFLNNDTEVITPDWIEGMVEQAQRASIGAVGALLLYPDGLIQHAGVVLGIGEVAGHTHHGFDSKHPGYFGKIILANNYSAVTGACLMCRREVFDEVGGFDEQIAVAYNDVDLCLKMRQHGYYNIYLPHVVLYHYESKTRGYDDTPEKRDRSRQESKIIHQRWGEVIENDPCYNPNLTKAKRDYGLNILYTTLVEIVSVSLYENSPLLWGGAIDSPVPGKRFYDNFVGIRGWVVGKNHRVVAVEAIRNGEVIQENYVNLCRPDVAKVYPISEEEYSGFSLTVKVASVMGDTEIILQAVFEDGSRVLLGKVQLRLDILN
ncbi:tetratricopeptide repeat protein [Microcoleus sp. MOSTC5]|uniref:tetratricopeptide repeat protein n=1 Tax=Microcoleus sp. MOSTC5 TaxID=3055378 RepID=UPI002FD54A6B